MSKSLHRLRVWAEGVRRRGRVPENVLLGAMLLLLHGALWGDFASPLSRSIMLAHLGLVVIWQPIWRSDQRLDRGTAAIFVVLTLAFVVWLNWWFVFLWLLLLTGLVGGRVLFANRRERYVYLTTLVVLISEFLIGCIVPMFQVEMPAVTRLIFYYGLMVPPVVLLLLPGGVRAPADNLAVDFLHAVTLSALTAILALSSLLVMYSTATSYPVALVQSLLLIALFLLAISWLLDPHPGFSGLAQLWSRYVLNVGTPFERWLTGLSAVAQRHEAPEDFLEAAMAQFADLPWVEGVQWNADGVKGQAGGQTPHVNFVHGEGIEAAVYTLAAPGATLVLHGKLLVQVIDYFYTAKRAQQELTRRAHLQAVYETGARVTHDIKNLLQSLHTLTTAVSHASGERLPEVQQLMRRQLPHVTQRLALALDKLQAPGEGEEAAMVPLGEWWEQLKARHAAEETRFTAEVEAPPGQRVPQDACDSVVENLLENALYKARSEPGVAVTVALRADGQGAAVEVSDDGSAIPGPVARRLFSQPVTSHSGLGIGLYQAAKVAANAGYHLTLAENRDGRVRFRLAPAAGEGA